MFGLNIHSNYHIHSAYKLRFCNISESPNSYNPESLMQNKRQNNVKKETLNTGIINVYSSDNNSFNSKQFFYKELGFGMLSEK